MESRSNKTEMKEERLTKIDDKTIEITLSGHYPAVEIIRVGSGGVDVVIDSKAKDGQEGFHIKTGRRNDTPVKLRVTLVGEK